LGFVQADPIRAPARAQDLILRLRVKNYHEGDLDRRYARLRVDEDYCVNYGFLAREHLGLIHPRIASRAWDTNTARQAQNLLAFIQASGSVHPRHVRAEFKWGRVRNAWGGSSPATTQLLEEMHYRGMLRVKYREQGLRVYEAFEHSPDDRSTLQKAQELIDLTLGKYAPLPVRTLGLLCRHLRWTAPNLVKDVRQLQATAPQRLPSATLDGVTWLWPRGEDPNASKFRLDDELRLLAPFDPVVWDRFRFEQFWQWPYRFEAYTPAAKRKLGFYAMPLLWRGDVPGWVNLRVVQGRLHAECGYVSGCAPRDAKFVWALEAELARIADFLRVLSPQ
jgi:hypothetical protein